MSEGGRRRGGRRRTSEGRRRRCGKKGKERKKKEGADRAGRVWQMACLHSTHCLALELRISTCELPVVKGKLVSTPGSSSRAPNPHTSKDALLLKQGQMSQHECFNRERFKPVHKASVQLNFKINLERLCTSPCVSQWALLSVDFHFMCK